MPFDPQAFLQQDAPNADQANAAPLPDPTYNPFSPQPFDPKHFLDLKKQQEYGGIGQQALAGLEGAASAASFGASTPLEISTGLTTPQDIQARRDVNPITYGAGQLGGLAGTALAGTGGGALLGSAGEAAASGLGLGLEGASTASQIGASAAKGLVENGLFQAGDEASRAFTDPDQTIQNAAIDVGLGGLIGAGLGGVLGSVKPAWKSLMSAKQDGFVADLAQGLKYHAENPDPFGAAQDELVNLNNSTKNVGDLSLGSGVGEPPEWQFRTEQPEQFAQDYASRISQKTSGELPVEQVTNELSDFYSHVKKQADEVYGPNGLKAESIEANMPPKTPQLVDQAKSFAEQLDSQLDKMKAAPDSYPSNVVNKFEAEVNKYKAGALDVPEEYVPYELSESGTREIAKPAINKSPADIYNALNNMKQDMWEYAKLDKRIPKTDPSYNFIKDARGIASDLKSSLEDSSIWGKAAERQQTINKAFSEYLPTLQDFEKAATQEVNGETIISPGKVQNILKNADELKGGPNRQKLQNFLEKGNQYLDTINEANKSLGYEETPFSNPMNATKELLGKGPQTEGSRFADEIIAKSQAAEDKFALAQKDFQKKFGTDVLGDNEISSVKLQTFLRRKDKLSIGDTDRVLKNYMEAAQEYRESRAQIANQLGKQIPSDAVSLNKLKEVMDMPDSAGRKMADWLYSYEQSKINPRMFEPHRLVHEQLENALTESGKKGLRTILPSILDNLLQKAPNGTAMEAALNVAKAASKGQSLIQKAAKAVMSDNTLEPVIGSKLIPDIKKVASLDDKLKQYQKDPNLFMKQTSDMAHYLPSHTTALASTSAQAVQYLNGLRPNPQKQNFFDREPSVDPVKKQEFNRALEIAQNPLSVMKDIKQGTLVPADIVHLQALYPKAYNQMKVALLDGLSQVEDPSKVPYTVKMSTSLFLGQPMDSTLTPQSIQTLQSLNTPQPSQTQQPAQHATKKGTAHLNQLSDMYKTPLQIAQSPKQS